MINDEQFSTLNQRKGDLKFRMVRNEMIEIICLLSTSLQL